MGKCNLDVCEKLDTIGIKLNNLYSNQKVLLGLAHENMFIDETEFDENGNLVSARLRIYSNSNSVGTNNNIIGTYSIQADSNGVCKFETWKQVQL